MFPELRCSTTSVLGAYARAGDDVEREAERLLDRFPRLRARRNQRAGLALRRRAADAGDRARPDGATARAAARRALARPRAEAGRRALRSARPSCATRASTILLVDQMAALALSVADRAYVLQSGAIVHAGSAQPRCAPIRPLAQAYLGDASADETSYEGGHRWISSCAMPALIGAEQRDDRHRHRRGPHRRDRAAPRRRRRDASTSAGRLVTPGFIETHIHLDKSRILDRCKAEKGDLEEAIGEVARAEEGVHAGGRLQPRQAHAGERHPQRHHAHAHAARGRSRHRPARPRRRAAADRRIQMGDRHRDLHLPAGGPAQQSRHRRADGRGAEERRQRRRRRALYRHQSARPDRPHLRDRARVRHRHRHASRFRRRPRTTSTSSTSASRPSKFKYGGRVAIGHVTKLSARAAGAVRASAPSAWRTPASRSPCCPRPTSI